MIRTTYENAIKTREFWRALNVQSGLLMTSGAPMPRALATFRKAGLDVRPATVDIHAAGAMGQSVLDVLPSADAVQLTTDAAREWLARAGYWLLGQA